MIILDELTGLKILSVWNRMVNVWGSQIRTVSFDRLSISASSRAGFMGRSEKAILEQRVRARDARAGYWSERGSILAFIAVGRAKEQLGRCH